MEMLRHLCPNCGQLSFTSEPYWGDGEKVEETCGQCGYSRIGISVNGNFQKDEEVGGFGQIAYIDRRTRQRIIIPFDAKTSKLSAKRAFMKLLRQIPNAQGEGRELKVFDQARQCLEQYDFKNKKWEDMTSMKASLGDDNRKRWEENYCIETRDEDTFLAEIDEMELETLWINDVVSKDIRLTAIPTLMESAEISAKFHLDPEQCYENAEDGTKLILTYGDKHYNVSNIARATLYETAKLWGSSLGRLPACYLADNLNHSLTVAKGTSLMLVRQGKVMALHSDGSYVIMPISTLVDITKRALSQYGEVRFECGFHSNAYTSAVWSLPDAQDALIDAYQNALKNAASHNHAINFMPVVRFSASDTAHSSAILRPMFQKTNGTVFPLGEGISVKHERKGSSGDCGVKLFEQQAGQLYAKFGESIEDLKKMAETSIYNPQNCVVGIFNWINRSTTVIPRKYADVIREEVEIMAVNTPVLSMHDIYLSMTECVGLAQQAGASQSSLINIEEAISRVMKLDWKSFDIGGVVAWGEKRIA